MMELTQGQNWWLTAAIAVGTFVLGLLVPRFWMTRKERKDVEQANYENSTKLLADLDKARDAYTTALKTYCDAPDVSVQMFTDIATTGTAFFVQVSLAADAILSGKVDPHVRDNSFLPRIEDAATRILPAHYNTLAEIAEGKGFPWTGRLRRRDYQGVYAVMETFGQLQHEGHEDA